ncbi:MAG: TVP38/TMEM64 family protein, partial [Chloroflexota bacterium]
MTTGDRPRHVIKFIKINAPRITAFIFWLTLIGGYQWYAFRNDLTPIQIIESLMGFITSSAWGPLIYILFYAIRPLILFPATIMTLAGGFLFGPISGVIYTILGSNISATVAYVIGQYFGQGLLMEDSTDNIMKRYAQRMRKNSFETVIIMRFIFLPYDLVNYLAGFLRINWLSFILATILGSIPGTIAFV